MNYQELPWVPEDFHEFYFTLWEFLYIPMNPRILCYALRILLHSHESPNSLWHLENSLTFPWIPEFSFMPWEFLYIPMNPQSLFYALSIPLHSHGSPNSLLLPENSFTFPWIPEFSFTPWGFFYIPMNPPRHPGSNKPVQREQQQRNDNDVYGKESK